MRLIVDNGPIDFEPGESVLVALLRAGEHPTGGGCLCLAGDCPHCLATVDGIAYVRTCQIQAKPGMVIERQHIQGACPPLYSTGREEESSAAPGVLATNLHCDVVVLGLGSSGIEAAERARSAGKEVVTLDASNGQEVIGIYPGPMVVARTDEGILQVHPREEVVVATGAAEIQPVAPGNQLAGLVTARAAEELAAAGIDLGRVVAVGKAPAGVEALLADGELARFEGEGRVEAVVVRDAENREQRYECDTVSLGLGLHPRDALARMGHGLPVHKVGDAALESDIPPCPKEGVVCPCSEVTVDDLDHVWNQGFRELELVKRATLAGTGTCQGSCCIPHIRSFLQERGKELQAPFTARPVNRQLTIGEIAAGTFHHATPRTALHEEHLRLGAQMERSGGWWRPWNYGDTVAEYWAVREGVSICDVGTLGKFLLSGPDALELLEALYPTQVSTLEVGRSRYVLLLDERGYVLDDGLIARDGDTRFTLSLTSGGATFGELWFRDWAESLGDAAKGGLDVRLLNQTMSLGAINATGPLAAELLSRAGVKHLPIFAAHGQATVAGIDCRIFRLSFTGELSYELHHPMKDSVALWRRLLALGKGLGIRAHGLETLLQLRLEKGHIVVGKDTDYDSTPRRIDHEWAVKLDKPHFVGRQAVLRTNKIPLNRQLVGLEMEQPAPIEGAVIWKDGRHAGTVTSSADSHRLGKAVMLGWLQLEEGELPAEVEIDGRPARRVETPFYDPKNERSRAKVVVKPEAAPAENCLPVLDDIEAGALGTPSSFQPFEAVRIVASPEALANAPWPDDALVLPIARDEVLVSSPLSSLEITPEDIGDPHAIVEPETGFSALWLAANEAEAFLASACCWKLPAERPAFAQGSVADLPVKLWFEEEHVLMMVPAPLAFDLEERMETTLASLDLRR